GSPRRGATTPMHTSYLTCFPLCRPGSHAVENDLQDTGKTLNANSRFGMAQAKLRGHGQGSDNGPRGVVRINSSEFPVFGTFFDQSAHGFPELRMIGPEIEEGRPLGRTVVQRIHDPHSLDVLRKERKCPAKKVEEPLTRAPPGLTTFPEDRVEFREGTAHQLDVDPLLIAEIVIEDGLAHAHGSNYLAYGRCRISFTVE